MSDMRDVLLVGDGPAGSGLAHFLAKQGRAVLLIDQADYPCDKTCGDGPTPRVLRVLRTMGVLDEVAAAGQHINGVHIYALGGRRIEAPITPWHDLPAYTLVVPRYRLDDWLRRKAVAAGAEFRPHVEATEVLREGNVIIGCRPRTRAGRRPSARPRRCLPRARRWACWNAPSSCRKRRGLGAPRGPTARAWAS